MQASVWKAVEGIARVDALKPADNDLELPDDFGFFHPPDVVLEVWMMMHQYHILPEAGGWLDQSETWQHDLSVCRRLYNVAVQKEQNGQTGVIVDDMPALPRMFGE